MKSSSIPQMKPQDIVVLAKLIVTGDEDYTQMVLSETLHLSQSEISNSLARSVYSGLLINNGKQVNRQPFFDFIQFGLRVVFPQKPGPIVRGIPTAHSAPPLVDSILGASTYVWPYAKGRARGESIAPLYPTVPKATLLNGEFYEMLALIDAVRVGRNREKNLALEHLEKRIL
ncbi:hypothetical protein [Robiginitalea biformata]|nr:hypothetical protein [Robiginitalea biformata]